MMTAHGIAGLAAAWVETYKAGPDVLSACQRSALIAKVNAMLMRPEQMWAFITAVLACQPSAAALTALAVGPLEDLLALHGPVVIERVEALARRNTSFRECLRAVWLEAQDTAVWRRVYAAAGVEPPCPMAPILADSPEWAFTRDRRH